jgi:multicomponent K+:H+ antiporter subunit C
MEGIYALCVGLLSGCGIFLMLRRRTFTVVLGITMLSYAVNLFLFASGGLTVNAAAILGSGQKYADPLTQALVLTAIVIGFAMTAFVMILAMVARAELGNDHVDGRTLDHSDACHAAERDRD